MEHSDRNDSLEALARRDAYTERPLPLDIVDMVDVCPFKRKKRRGGGAPSEIVIHHSWTKTLQKMIDTLVRKDCGTHYAIDRDGTVYNLTLDTYNVSHCVKHNETGIGIDLIRGEGQKILDCQYESLNRLLVRLIMRWNLGEAVLHKKVVFYHRDLRPTECPGEIDDSKIRL